MSNYLMNTKNPNTGKFETAVWMDNYFGSHHYGVRFQDKSVVDPDKVELETLETNNEYLINDTVKYKSSMTTEDLINVMTRELTRVIPRPKSLVRKLLNDFRNHIIVETKESPMGISQWKEYGKKYGYWSYFEGEVGLSPDLKK